MSLPPSVARSSNRVRSRLSARTGRSRTWYPSGIGEDALPSIRQACKPTLTPPQTPPPTEPVVWTPDDRRRGKDCRRTSNVRLSDARGNEREYGCTLSSELCRSSGSTVTGGSNIVVNGVFSGIWSNFSGSENLGTLSFTSSRCT